MKLTKQQLADALSVTTRTVATWRKEGMPIVEGEKRGNAQLFDMAEVVEWLRDQARQEGRKVKSKGPDAVDWTAEKRKIEVQQLRGELISVDDIRLTWNEKIAAVRKMVLSIPNRCAGLMVSVTEMEARQVLDKECKLILNEAADYDDEQQRDERKAG